MRVAIRVDASSVVGSGHVMRCIALATALRGRGADIVFISRKADGDLTSLLGERGFEVRSLTSPSADENVDARQTLAKISDVDWLIVDHYGLGAAWESQMRASASRLLAVDDLANRSHTADVVLDATFPGDRTRYANLVPDRSSLLLGPRYALIDDAYVGRGRSNIPSDPTRVLVFFGGSDLPNLTARTLRALGDERFAGIQVDVVAGATNPHRSELERLVAARPDMRVLTPQPNLADLMAPATAAVGAGGVTTWERLCMGVPSVVVSIAENQRASCRALAAINLISYLGDEEHVTDATIADGLHALLSDPEAMRQSSAVGQAHVDGLGAVRVAEILMPTPAEGSVLRRARPEDAGLYFTWVNDPDVRRQSLRTAPIDWEQHRRWFRERLDDPQSHLFVLEARGVPVAQARFEMADRAATLSYSVDTAFRGRGWAHVVLARSMNALTFPGPIVADVRSDNAASMHSLIKAGFVPAERSTSGTARLTLHGGLDGTDDRLGHVGRETSEHGQ